MILFRPLIRYADFNGRASRSEYWLFAVLQGVWYGLLIGLAAIAMGHGAPDKATPGVLFAFGLMGASIVALIVPNYAVLTRRLHDSGRGAIWLLLMAPSILSSMMTIGTIVTAFGAVGAGAGGDAFLATALAGLGAAGLLGLVGMVGQMILVVLTLLPGVRGENRFGPDPRDPVFLPGGSGGSTLDEARLDALFAEAKRAGGAVEEPYKPIFDFGPGPAQPVAAPPPRVSAPADWRGPASHANPVARGVSPAPVFGKRRA